MANSIKDLRDHLFDTITALKDKDNPMEIGRARAISDISQVIINTAKAEVDFMKAGGVIEGEFFVVANPDRPKLGVITHRIKG